MARVVSIANQKGGVGKTTTSINLAVALALAGRKCLLLDIDPQTNATSGLGLEPADRHPLATNRPMHEAIEPADVEGLSVLPGSQSLADADALSSPNLQRAASLRQELANGLSSFDDVLIDCPPSLGQLTRAALAASTEVFIPIQCEYFAMEGLTQMVELIRQTKARDNHRLRIGGILLTMFDSSLELAHEVADEVREHFGDGVFRTIIPRDVAISEAPSHGKSVIQYDPRARGTRAYVELCLEVLDRG